MAHDNIEIKLETSVMFCLMMFLENDDAPYTSNCASATSIDTPSQNNPADYDYTGTANF